ncbi:MAG: excinuclease ABC subunit UvrC [Desulfobulbaceae bacterium]
MPPSSPPDNAPAGSDPLSPAFLRTVSTGPGVYLMSAGREILYVGKARNLRKRLSSYRRTASAEHSKTAALIARVQRIETILTTTEKEALILEASLIKKHRPRYNVILRDDKNYPLIKVTVREKWPRIVVTRKRTRDGSRYFGPYSSASAMRESIRLLHSLFPLRRCPRVRPRSRPCLNHQMGQCLAPCALPVDQETYREMVDNVLLVLEGRNRELIDTLREKMRQAAREMRFEEAALYRDQVRGLEKTLERQVVSEQHGRDRDVYGLVRKDVSVGVAILFVRAGVVSGAQGFFLHDPIGSDAAILTETIMQFYTPLRQPPPELFLPCSPEDENLVREHLSDLRGGAVRFAVPKRGKRMQLMEMARENAGQVLSDRADKEKSWDTLRALLGKSLRLDRGPDHIECVDISTTGGRQAVGSLVCFRDGEPDKQGYRIYRIREKDTPDDYAMMREVLRRRLVRGAEEDTLPDLLLLDGGRGQLGLAVDLLRELGLEERLELAAIAKEKEGDGGDRIYRPGRKNPLSLKRNNPALLFLMRIRDEAHRFGITRHRRLRGKDALASRLDRLEGVGPHRRTLLLNTFGSIARLRKASIADLRAVDGIGPVLAASIHRQLQEDDAP